MSGKVLGCIISNVTLVSTYQLKDIAGILIVSEKLFYKEKLKG